jgi:hypothetical protein
MSNDPEGAFPRRPWLGPPSKWCERTAEEEEREEYIARDSEYLEWLYSHGGEQDA